MRTHYQVLGVHPASPDVEVKRAYRKLVRVHHPDMGGDEEVFKEVKAAFEVLGDPVKRATYDSLRLDQGTRVRVPDPGATEQGSATSSSADPSEGPIPSQGGQPRPPRPKQGLRRGEDMTDDMRLTRVEVALGTTRLVRVEGRDVEVELPPGLLDGQTWTVEGGGAPGPGGPGDLHLGIRHDVSTEGLDVLERIELPWSTFVLGGTAGVKVPDGSVREVWVKARSTPGTSLRLKGCGVLDPVSSSRGDLVLELTLKLVGEVDPTTVLLLEELARRGL